MKSENRIKNQGMSLVELLVAVGVLGIAMVGILSLMNASARYFSSSSREVEVQQELQTTFSMVSGMISEANYSSPFEWTSDGTIIRGKSYAYAIVKSGNKLYAKEFNLKNGETPTKSITSDENLLADHVVLFEIKTNNFADGYVTLAMKVKYGAREAAMTKNIFMRNAGKEMTDFLGQCDTQAAGGSGQTITFVIKQETGGTITNGTKGVITVKIAAGSGWSVSKPNVSVTSCNVTGVNYNCVTGSVSIYCTATADWASGNDITVSLTLTGGSISRDNCRVIGIRK